MFETECRELTQEHELRIKMIQNNVEFICDTAGKQQNSVPTCLCQLNNYFGFVTEAFNNGPQFT